MEESLNFDLDFLKYKSNIDMDSSKLNYLSENANQIYYECQKNFNTFKKRPRLIEYDDDHEKELNDEPLLKEAIDKCEARSKIVRKPYSLIYVKIFLKFCP